VSFTRTDFCCIELKNAMINGCDEYLKASQNSDSILNMFSFFQRNQGMNRANKTMLSLQRIPDNEDSAILSFCIALFKTSSKRLTSAVAEKIIQGFLGYQIFYILNSIPLKIPVNTLSSKVVSRNILNQAAIYFSNLEEYEDSINKKSLLNWVLNQIPLNQHELEQMNTYLLYLDDNKDLSVMENYNIENLKLLKTPQNF
jgi:hypothetical protein